MATDLASSLDQPRFDWSVTPCQPARTASVTVERVAPGGFANWAGEVADLAARAMLASPFQGPATLAPARARFGDESIVILAARDGAARAGDLLGLWMLRRCRDLASGGVELLQAPLMPLYEPSSVPLLDRERAAEALGALFDHLAASPDLPRIVRAPCWPASFDALLPPSARLHRAETWLRGMVGPMPERDAETYLKRAMGSAYRKRKVQARTLAELGAVTGASLRGAEALARYDDFLALEAAGWKGRAGTALACVPADAAYLRAALAGFAAEDRLAVDLVALDDRPIAIGVMVETAGLTTFLKTAYDESLSRFSPGVLLDMAIVRRLYASGGPALDSATTEYTDVDRRVWGERLAMSRALIDCGAGFSFHVARAADSARWQLRRQLRQRVPSLARG